MKLYGYVLSKKPSFVRQASTSEQNFRAVRTQNTQIYIFTFLCNSVLLSNRKGETMSRLTIEITDQQHQSIKALAALQGKSIKEYAMQRLLPLSRDEEKAIQELEALLTPRIEAAERGEVISASVSTIFEETLATSHT